MHGKGDQNPKVLLAGLYLRELLHRHTAEGLPPYKAVAGKTSGNGNAVGGAGLSNAVCAIAHTIEIDRFMCCLQAAPQVLDIVFPGKEARKRIIQAGASFLTEDRRRKSNLHSIRTNRSERMKAFPAPSSSIVHRRPLVKSRQKNLTGALAAATIGGSKERLSVYCLKQLAEAGCPKGTGTKRKGDSYGAMQAAFRG